jgi:hypothetical protein
MRLMGMQLLNQALLRMLEQCVIIQGAIQSIEYFKEVPLK